MSIIINIRDLPARWEEVLALTNAGDEVLLSDGATSCAKLIAWCPNPPVPGLHPGAMVMADDFDAPLDDEFWTGSP